MFMSRPKQLLKLSTVKTLWSHAGPRAAAAWFAVYVLACLTGQRFNTDYLNYGWQLIPWDVLSTDPLRSVFYLHIQPPLWNLFLGTTAWMSPFSDRATLQVLMALIGFAVAWLAAVLGRRLGLSRRVAVIVALIATLHPEVLKGAFEPTYELATAALLLAVLIAVSDLTRKENVRRSLVILASTVTVTALTRSLYHPAWALVIVVFGLWLMRRRINWKASVLVLSIPVIFMGSWMAKNEVMFGHTTMSSWFGMNLQRAVIPVLPKDDLDEMYAKGQISDIAMIGPFGKYELYENVFEDCVPTRSHRSLAEPMRTTDQWSPNFNYQCFLPLYDQAGKDAIAVIKEHPEAWLEGRLWSLRTTIAVSPIPSESKSEVMTGLDRVFSIARLDFGGVLSTKGWGTPIYGQLEAHADFGLMLIPMYLTIGWIGLWQILQRLRRKQLSAASTIYVVGSFTVAFTVIVGALAELGEQSRFRTMIDPIVTVMFLALVIPVVQRWYRRFRTQAG
jgi:hypothetical protein